MVFVHNIVIPKRKDVEPLVTCIAKALLQFYTGTYAQYIARCGMEYTTIIVVHKLSL